ncbi:hypothetical protein GGTG_05710 [Gaeumannomyces tritici R3-111a-1]|uniref:Uncharacterized protein n=1 Tax=Gaeumannomyces tritici (strain R3-111a-1) TaxID=644352 RepID=J3NWP8_GAET3|nr:hypothetical protein GGTG_05710 [Gaeumannomyces tritici R3-111a-1]EJT75780.1 hypothetical protein GGTG_05710 [Gaeumannomyces tritici R3-111a-1]
MREQVVSGQPPDIRASEPGAAANLLDHGLLCPMGWDRVGDAAQLPRIDPKGRGDLARTLCFPVPSAERARATLSSFDATPEIPTPPSGPPRRWLQHAA